METVSVSGLKDIFWLLGFVIGIISTAISATWWFSKQRNQDKREVYIKINSVKKDLEKEIKDSVSESSSTRERVGLLEQSHNHLEQRIDGIDDKLESMQKDITSTKENISNLAQKQSENHLTVIGEIRGIGDKIIINKLQQQQQQQQQV